MLEYINCWKSSSRYSAKMGIIGSFLVVEKKDGSSFLKSKVLLNLFHLKDEFIVPNIASFEDAHTPYQLFPLITGCNRIKLKNACQGGVSPQEFDPIVSMLSESTNSIALLPTSKMDACHCSVDGFCGFHQIFAGSGLPKTDKLFCKFNVPNSELLIRHKVAPKEEFKNFIPLSTSCFNTQFHDIQVVPKFVNIDRNSFGKNGIFPSRKCSCHCSHSSYLGKDWTDLAVFQIHLKDLVIMVDGIIGNMLAMFTGLLC